MASVPPNIPGRQCQFCQLPISTNGEVAYQHFLKHVVNHYYCCGICLKKFKVKPTNLRRCFLNHMGKAHPYNQQPPNHGLRYHKCVLCGAKIYYHNSHDLFSENRLNVKKHYQHHYPTSNFLHPRPMKCLFEGCDKLWKKRQRVLSCFHDHDNVDVPVEFDLTAIQRNNTETDEGDTHEIPVDVVDDGNTNALEASQPPALPVNVEDRRDDGNNNANPVPSTPKNNFQEIVEDGDEIGKKLNHLFGALKYIWRVQDEAIDLVASTFSDCATILKRTIMADINQILDEFNIDESDPPICEIQNHLCQKLNDPFHSTKYGSKYRRKQQFDATENVIAPYLHYFKGNFSTDE